jgi:membrane protease YdiL (CAAX protease family)
MPNDSLFDLTTAPFRFSVLKKPEVWGGLVGALAAGVGISYLAYSSNSPVTAQKFTTDTGLSPAIALPVGIGEESLFRGYLQSQLCEFFSPTTSIIVSSLAFGASHLPNALMLDPADRPRYFAVSIPFITALGGYMGWLTHKNHSLKESVALHTWYDFVLFAASIWADRAAGMRAPQHFSMSIPL